MNDALLEVRNLSKHFPVRGGLVRHQIGTVKAVDNVSFTVHRGEILGLVGESGCGKTTTGRVILRALEPTGGTVLFHTSRGTENPSALRGRQLQRFRRHAQMVFQDPYASLNPRMTIGEIIEEPLLCLTDLSPKARQQRVAELLELVGLPKGARTRFPHAFSGGQRQRIGLARAIATNPDLVILDEAVSALDVSVQAQILNLLMELQAQLGLTYIFISHDLAVVRHICDRVAVMYLGKIVELAPTEKLFAQPQHPYTEALLGAILKPQPGHRLRPNLGNSEIPDPAQQPTGCAFHPRCHYAENECHTRVPELRQAPANPSRFTACHFAEALTLQGQSDSPQQRRNERTPTDATP